MESTESTEWSFKYHLKSFFNIFGAHNYKLWIDFIIKNQINSNKLPIRANKCENSQIS